MARPARIEYAGGMYYIRSRGRSFQPIFRDEEDRSTFLEILAETVYRFGWLCHSYCLLNDHYHLILETPQGNLSRGMRQVNGLYTQTFNRKYHRKGPLFGGRFRSVIFEKARYLLPLHRHMVLNPVRAGLSQTPESWRWSSHFPLIKRESPPSFLSTRSILSRFSSRDHALTIERYKVFIASGKRDNFTWQDLKFQVFLGSDSFIEKIKALLIVHKSGRRGKTTPETGRDRLPLDRILEGSWSSRRERDALIYRAYVHQGYTLREIADFLRIHMATASRAVRKVERRMLRQR